jgi:hypothetical protein
MTKRWMMTAIMIGVLLAITAPLFAADRTLTIGWDAKTRHGASLPVTITSWNASLEDDYWMTTLVYKNVSGKTITAIQFDLTLVDAFGEEQDSFTAVSNVRVAPGDTHEGTWKEIAMDSVGTKVRVSVYRVLFSDGSIWSR